MPRAIPIRKGGARPPQGVQRGSVVDMTMYPGDPLTPGVGATPGAKRLTRAEAPTILKIPTLPISYADASKIMAALAGPGRHRQARAAASPIAYHWGGTRRGQGPSGGQVRLVAEARSTTSSRRCSGSTYPDQWIVRGNHRDGWVFGAADPLTGQVALMSEAKALGQLYRQGWRPARTIVYASWDAEEPSLLGSTEWAETHADELKRKAVLYINTDNNGRGFLYAEGSHELQHFVDSAANDVLDPQTGVPVAERGRADILAESYTSPGARPPRSVVDAAKAGGDLPLGPLGSGSDYSRLRCSTSASRRSTSASAARISPAAATTRPTTLSIT